MDNYVYIVASLPDIAVSYEGAAFDYAAVKESIVELLSEKDQKLVELLEEGFDENTLGAEFYKKAADSKNRFIREYFDFDGRLRNMKVAYLAKRLDKKGDAYLVDMPEFIYRTKVKAGLAGYAQVYGKYNTSALDKLKLDLTYIANYSVLLDFQIIFETIKILFQKESTEGFDSERAKEMHDADCK